jgi:Fungal specific transcription factor domain
VQSGFSRIPSHQETSNGIGRQNPGPSEGQGIYHFRTHLLDLISFSQNGLDNPFLEFILPLAASSDLLRWTIEAMATAHLHNLGVASASEPLRLQSKALRGLSSALSRSHEPTDATFKEEIVSSMLILVYYETTFGLSAQTTRWHLSAVKNILDRLCDGSDRSKRFEFLLRLFAYFDLLVAFSLRLQPLASIQIYEGFSATGLCSVFGYTSTLYPYLHSLATLLAKRQYSTDSDMLIDDISVNLLERELSCWQPPMAIPSLLNELSTRFSPHSGSQSLTQHNQKHEQFAQTALAYRAAALLLLHAKLRPSLNPISSPSSTLAADFYYQDLLGHLLRIHALSLNLPHQASQTSSHPSTVLPANMGRVALPPVFTALASTSTPFSTITWPLHTAAVHAKTASDRAILSSIFERVYQRHRFGIVAAAKKHVEDVWKEQGECIDEGTEGGSFATSSGLSGLGSGAIPPLLA